MNLWNYFYRVGISIEQRMSLVGSKEKAWLTREIKKLTFSAYIWSFQTQSLSCYHTKMKALHPVRSAKLSILRPSQYYGGGPRGNTVV